MSTIPLLVTLLVIGVVMWLINTQIGSIVDGRYLKLFNMVVLVAVVLGLILPWLLRLLGHYGVATGIHD